MSHDITLGLVIKPSDTSLTAHTTPVTLSTLPSAHLNNALHKTCTVNSLTKYRFAPVATSPSRSVLKPAQSYVFVPSSMTSATNLTSLSLAWSITSTSLQTAPHP